MILKYFPLHPAMLPCKSVLPTDFNNETSLADGRQVEEIYYMDAKAECLNALMCLLPLPLEILPSAAPTARPKYGFLPQPAFWIENAGEAKCRQANRATSYLQPSFNMNNKNMLVCISSRILVLFASTASTD